MELIDSKVTNNMGYAYLVLNKVDQQIAEISAKCEKKELTALF
jgi:hypothetical protein